MPSLGPMEILVILVVALLVLGPTKLPEAGRQVGRALAEFRRWSTGMQQELRDALEIDLDADQGPPTYTSGTAANGAAGTDRAPAAAGPARTPAELRPPTDFPEQQSFS